MGTLSKTTKANVGLAIAEGMNMSKVGETVNVAMGSAALGWAGAKIGAKFGMFGGPVGAVVGAGVGAL